MPAVSSLNESTECFYVAHHQFYIQKVFNWKFSIYGDCVLMLQVLDDPSEDNLHMGMHVFVLCVQILLLCSCPVSVSLWRSMHMAPTSVRVIYSEMVVSLQTCLGLALCRSSPSAVPQSGCRVKRSLVAAAVTNRPNEQKNEIFGLTCSCFLLSLFLTVFELMRKG